MKVIGRQSIRRSGFPATGYQYPGVDNTSTQDGYRFDSSWSPEGARELIDLRPQTRIIDEPTNPANAKHYPPKRSRHAQWTHRIANVNTPLGVSNHGTTLRLVPARVEIGNVFPALFPPQHRVATLTVFVHTSLSRHAHHRPVLILVVHGSALPRTRLPPRAEFGPTWNLMGPTLAGRRAN